MFPIDDVPSAHSAAMHHRHPGADVGALEPLPVQRRRARDDDAMRVAEDDPRAHRDELVDEEEPALEHLLEDEDRPARLRRDGDRDGRQVGRERGPDAALDLRDLPAEVVLDVEVLAGGDADARLGDLHLDPQLAERGDDRDQVVRLDVLDDDVAAGHRRQADEARDLDVVGADPVLAAAELVDAAGCGGRSSRCRRSARRARRGSGRDPGCAARRRRARAPSPPRRGRRP